MKKVIAILVAVIGALCGTFLLSKSRTFQLFGEIVPRVETERKVVALTFDDGPLDETVDAILEELRKENVKATFFVCGAEIEKNRAAAAKLVGAGHELGNHSFSHVRMWFKSPSFYRREFEQTDALIRAAGHEGPIHVRAPYCKKLVGLPRYFAKTNRVHVTFDVEPESDPEIDRNFTRIFSHVVENVRPGSIVLLHPWYRNRTQTRAAVPLIVKTLKEAGYEFVTVDELLKLRKS